MPVYQDSSGDAHYAVCDLCAKQSEIIYQDLRISILLLAEKYGWCLTEDGLETYCCIEHLDQQDINSIDKLLEDYDDEHGLN